MAYHIQKFEMKYEITPNYEIEGLEFTGLTGNESVFSVKEALDFLTLANPGYAFADAVKNGAYKELNDIEYGDVFLTVQTIVGLFRYEDTDETSLQEMNVLMLLKNAIIALVKKDVALRQLQKQYKTQILEVQKC